jgi:S-sulfo-L-cysteine synthase (O-acetyl-L-serine-dependent)
LGATKNAVLGDFPGVFARAARENLIDCIGNTPLLRLQRIGREFPFVEIHAKAEWFNPGGSVKDRAALRMILEGERRGELAAGKTILDSTSGNTGIAYAMIGAARGYRVKLCLPASASAERKKILRAYGAELVITPGDEGSDGAIRRVREIYAAEPEKYFYPDQYSNPGNVEAHMNTTAPEIWEQTRGRVTHFVAGLGTSGTFVGTARRLKEFSASIRAISVQPDAAFHGLEGMKHMASALVPKIYDSSLADYDLAVRTEDAYAMVRRLAREEGLLVGISSGAAVCGCLEVARRLGDTQRLRKDYRRDAESAEFRNGEPERAVIVTVFPDSGDKYLSERFWDED